jgi:hypothetical protein
MQKPINARKLAYHHILHSTLAMLYAMLLQCVQLVPLAHNEHAHWLDSYTIKIPTCPSVLEDASRCGLL